MCPKPKYNSRVDGRHCSGLCAPLAALNAADGMGKGFELVTILQAVAQRWPAEPALLARYRQLARGLGEFGRGQLEKALDHLNA